MGVAGTTIHSRRSTWNSGRGARRAACAAAVPSHAERGRRAAVPKRAPRRHDVFPGARHTHSPGRPSHVTGGHGLYRPGAQAGTVCRQTDAGGGLSGVDGAQDVTSQRPEGRGCFRSRIRSAVHVRDYIRAVTMSALVARGGPGTSTAPMHCRTTWGARELWPTGPTRAAVG